VTAHPHHPAAIQREAVVPRFGILNKNKEAFPMKFELSKNRDFWAGMMLIVIGAAAMLIARDYRFGSTLSMGPGFFPTMLGGILIAFGICIVAVGLRNGENIKGRLSPRALILLPLSLILFGILIELAGFILAQMALVIVSAASGKEFKVIEVSLLAVILTVAMAVIFIWGLGLPYPLIKGF
jgi:hypothetical protein